MELVIFYHSLSGCLLLRCILMTFLLLCKQPAGLRHVCGAVWHTKSHSVSAVPDDILRGVCFVSFCVFHLHTLLLPINTKHFIIVNTKSYMFRLYETAIICIHNPECEKGEYIVCMCISIHSPCTDWIFIYNSG